MGKITNEQLDSLIKSAVNSSGPLPHDEKFSQIISALRELRTHRNLINERGNFSKSTNNHPAHGPVSLDRLHHIREILSKAAAQSDGGNLGYAMADAVKVIDGAIAAFGAEPVAWQWEYRDKRHVTNDQRRAKIVAADGEVLVQPLYTAPPAPVVPDEMTKRKACSEYSGRIEVIEGYRNGWNACRAAMLQADNHTEQHLDMVDHFVDANKKDKDVTLINEGNIPATQIKPVADLYGITSPTGSETTFTFDASEASSFVGSDWSVQEYVELERYQQAVAGNSPVTPDTWIPVSERIPDEIGRYWCYVEEQNSLGKSHFQWNCSWNSERWWVEGGGGTVTHWMPLAEPPRNK